MEIMVRLPPDDGPRWPVIGIMAGATSGFFLGVAAGNRHVSVFWLYLAVIFGLITLLPCVYYEKGDTFLPLGTIYVNPPYSRSTVIILGSHCAITVVLAFIAASFHRRVQLSRNEKPE